MKANPLTSPSFCKNCVPSMAEKLPTKETTKYFNKINIELGGKVVDLNKVDRIYHRTTPKNAQSIIRNGKLLAQPPELSGQEYLENVGTSEISLSVNPSNTFAGSVRLIYNVDELKVELEPVLYPTKISGRDLSASKLTMHDVRRRYKEEHFPDTEVNRNDLRAIMGISPKRYLSEAEVMAQGNITTEPQSVEMWLCKSVEGFNVSCKNRGETDLYWKFDYMDGWEYFKNWVQEYRKLNEVNKKYRGGKLKLRSCWELVNFGGKYPDIIMETTEKNLNYFQDLIEQYWGTGEYLKEGAKEIRSKIGERTEIEEAPSPPPPEEREFPLSEFKCKC